MALGFVFSACVCITSRIMTIFTVLGFFVGICVADNVLAETQYRLPTDIVPIKYTIDLKFPETAFSSSASTFTGQAKIDFKILNGTEYLKLHVSNVYIRITKLTLNNKVLTRSQYSIAAATEIITIPDLIQEHQLVKDQTYSVVFEYTGRVSNTDNYGVYKNSYTKSDGNISHLLATQFGATYARRAFPCFDEPSFKATFDVSISYSDNNDLGLDVLFNTDEVDRNNSTAGFTTVTFKTTPVMSTYLIAFVISDLTSTSGESVGDTKYAVWSTENQAKTSRSYAAAEGPKILNALNEYIGKDYSDEMSKIDHVALPDFYAGAIENWGLLIYRESYLLLDEDNTIDTAQQSIARVIAHESSYQWFGNLITCDWWTESYLNEAFASYFEYFITHLVEPNWELDKQFVVNVLQPVLDLDSSGHLQALKSDVSSPEEIDNNFKQISIGKGGSILRMLSHIMGEEHFKEAVQVYVSTTELQHSTSTTSKFLEIFQTKVNPQYSAIDAYSSITLAEIMKNWIEKPGYPLLTASLNGNNLTISQERFLVSGEDKDSKWHVPITIAESESEVKFQVTATSAWLTPDAPEVTIELEHDNKWVLLNVLSTGFYRINYDKTLWTNIAEALQKDNFDGIGNLNRAQIVDDAFNLVKASKLTYPEVFNIIEFLKKDVSYFPWVPAFNGFEYIFQSLPSNSILKTKLQQHLLTLMNALYKSVPITEIKDNQIYTLTQTLAHSWACQLGEENCVFQAKKLFDEALKSGTWPNKNIRSLVYCTALRNSIDTNDYDFLWNLYSTTVGSSEKIEILKALGCSTNTEKLKQLLNETVKSDSQIRIQDAIGAFSAVYSGSDVGVDAALEFLIDNVDAILKKLTAVSDQRSVIIEIASRLTTSEQINKLKTLMESNSKFQEDLKEVAEESITQAETNLKWLTTHEAVLKEYLGITDGTDGTDAAGTITANLAILVLVNIIMLFGIT